MVISVNPPCQGYVCLPAAQRERTSSSSSCVSTWTTYPQGWSGFTGQLLTPFDLQAKERHGRRAHARARAAARPDLPAPTPSFGIVWGGEVEVGLRPATSILCVALVLYYLYIVKPHGYSQRFRKEGGVVQAAHTHTHTRTLMHLG